MREVLFRGKTPTDYEEGIFGEWVTGFYTRFNGTEHRIYSGYAETDCGDYYPDWFNVLPETVGQYTGLTDKNGEKIFEGDIVRQDYSKIINARYDPETLGFIDADDIEGHHIGVVKISPHNGVGMRNPMSYDDINDTQQKTKRFVNLASYRCEVIGNIHDNPDLLKGGEG